MGDPILKSNITRRVDFALFMVEALENDELVHEAPGNRRLPDALGARARRDRRTDLRKVPSVSLTHSSVALLRRQGEVDTGAPDKRGIPMGWSLEGTARRFRGADAFSLS